MRLTVVRRCFAAVALFGVLALVAACTGSGSTLLSPTGPSATVSRSLAIVPDPCAPTLARTIVPDPVPPPECEKLEGRFTGGGFQVNALDIKVTRGFTLHCDELLSNNFEVNWKSGGTTHNFHTDKNPEVTECSKPVVPNPPTADVSRIVILNQPGSLDGEDGHLITIVLEDWGEPGTADRAYIAVTVSRSRAGQLPSPRSSTAATSRRTSTSRISKRPLSNRSARPPAACMPVGRRVLFYFSGLGGAPAPLPRKLDCSRCVSVCT